MKKRLLALALSLVMVMSLLPATLTANAVITISPELEIQETPIDLTTLNTNVVGNALKVGADGYTATISQDAFDTVNKEANTHHISKKSFSGNEEKIFTQDIKIEKMPIFGEGQYAIFQSRAANGYFMLVGNDEGAKNYEVTTISIYRVDEVGNLAVAVCSGAYTFHEPIALGKKVGDRFKLTTHYKEDGKLDIYCDTVKVYSSTASVEYENGTGDILNALRIGYSSYGATAPANGDTSTLIHIYSVNKGVMGPHQHSGGNATCQVKAKCTSCGSEYGDYGLHTPGRNGKCTLCQSGGYIDYVNYDVIETPINISEFETKYGEALTVDGYTATISQTEFDATSGVSNKETGTHTISTKSYASPGEKIYSQDIQINKMPIFSTYSVFQSRSANGLYMLVGNDDGESPYEITIISIYRVDEVGNLALGIGKSDYTFVSPLYPLGKTLGQRFKLTTVFKEDGKLDVYCDGVLICSTTESVEYPNGTGDIMNALRIGYSSYGATAPASGDTSTDIKIYSLNDVSMVPHVHTPAEDDGDCTTPVACTDPDCVGLNAVDGKTHVAGEDDGDCTTPVACTNPGCTKNAVEAKTHVPGTDDGDCETPVACTNPGCTKNAVDACAHVAGEDDGDCTTPVKCINCNQNAVDAKTHTGEDDGDCSTAVACTNPGCTKNAVEAKTHVAGEDDGDCSTAVACTNPGCTKNAVEAKTHVAGEDDGDCTTAVACTNPGCTKNAVEAKTHTGGTATCEKKAECANCGKEYGELAAHKPGDEGDCLTGFTCTVCGKVTAAKESHTPAEDDGDCTTAIKCTVCGKETTAAKESHTPAEDDGDCTTAVKCTVCGTVTTAAKEAHTPAEDDGDCTTAIKCTVCGTVTAAAKDAHTPAEDDGDCTTAIKCTVCGTVTTAAKEAHTEKVVNAKPATETEKGYTGDKVCSVCGKEIAKGQEIPVLEPAPSEPTPSEPAPSEPSTPDTPVVNPETGDNGTAVYALLLAISMLAMVALMIPDIRSKLIRK